MIVALKLDFLKNNTVRGGIQGQRSGVGVGLGKGAHDLPWGFCFCDGLSVGTSNAEVIPAVATSVSPENGRKVRESWLQAGCWEHMCDGRCSPAMPGHFRSAQGCREAVFWQMSK